MLNSMTAFGNARATCPSGELTVEIRCVNHRYLDISLRTPERVRATEHAIRQAISKQLSRGKVECVVRLERSPSTNQSGLDISETVAREVVNALKTVANIAGHDASYKPDPATVLAWPGVLANDPEDHDVLNASVMTCVGDAIAAVVANRQREGAAIAEHLHARNAEIDAILTQLDARRPQVIANQRTRLETRLAELAAPLEQTRVEQEWVMAAQKLDIDEELSRLKTHVAELTHALSQPKPVGRRLDFLMQEFNREANTVGSKSGDSETTALTVDLKVLIEQMREQVQNVE